MRKSSQLWVRQGFLRVQKASTIKEKTLKLIKILKILLIMKIKRQVSTHILQTGHILNIHQ